MSQISYILFMKTVQEIQENKTSFLGLTTLYPEEFDHILPVFSELWYKFYAYFTLHGKRRKSKYWYAQKDTPTLPTTTDKLFFILCYYKDHPLQEYQAMCFEISQTKVSQWVRILTPILEETLDKLAVLPCRNGSILNRFLKDIPNSKTINIDVVEQSAPRPVSDDAQRAQYSGKAKDHTYKNKVDCTDNQYVTYLSPTFLGAVHDKKIADESFCIYPEGTRLRQDAGFQGYAPLDTWIEMPFKKPKNRELTKMQKWYNCYVGQRRIVVEHAIRGIKRFRIIQHACRLKGYWVRDQIMNICTALHNFRVKSPLRSYQSEFKFKL